MSSPTPRAVPARRATVRKTLAIWATLIAMFAFVYCSFSPNKGGSAGTNWTFFLELFGAIFVALLVLFALFMRRSMRELRRFRAENTTALAESARGNHEAARATLFRWVEQTHSPSVAAVARHNLAWILARMGNVGQAIEVATANDETHLAALERSGLAPTSAVDNAFYRALVNQLDDAETWMKRAAERNDQLALPSLSGMTAFARAVIDCRSGRHADASRMLEERWPEYEAVMTGDNIRMMRIVRAFARHAEGPRHAGAATIDLTSLRPAYPGEYAMLSADWPEMAAFLTVNGLV